MHVALLAQDVPSTTVARQALLFQYLVPLQLVQLPPPSHASQSASVPDLQQLVERHLPLAQVLPDAHVAPSAILATQVAPLT